MNFSMLNKKTGIALRSSSIILLWPKTQVTRIAKTPTGAGYGGEELFQRIEHIRATSVNRARGIADTAALNLGLEALSPDETVSFVRGFMLFSMLANLAEDRQGITRETGGDRAMDVAGEHRDDLLGGGDHLGDALDPFLAR